MGNFNKEKLKDRFLQRMRDVQGDRYELLGEYINTKSKTLFRHNVCGYEWETAPGNIMVLSGCPRCAGNINKTTEEFREEVYNLEGGEYELLGEYSTAKTKTRVKHVVCGSEYYVAPTDFISGKRCPECAGINIDTEKYKKRIHDKFGEEYIVLGDYTRADDPIKMRHDICGDIFDITPYSMYKKKNCTKCLRESQTKDTEWFVEQVDNLKGGTYTVIGEYVTKKTPIQIRHNICGGEWRPTPDNFLRVEEGCPHCARNYKGNTESYREYVKGVDLGQYRVHGEYINARTAISTEHLECSTVFYLAPDHFKRGVRCPRCFSSLGEQKVSGWLDEIGVEYLREKTFEGCKHKNLLRFDFYIPEYNLCIEFDGEQHVYPVRFGGVSEEEAYQLHIGTVKRDMIKNNFCFKNGIGLLRLPYFMSDEQNKIELTKAIEMSRSNVRGLMPKVETMI